ncbi:MAG: hypothetical protein RMJ66_08530 [Bacteroidia bacterium]|nr:hypothetical protein [Bacteroidia bacterium]
MKSEKLWIYLTYACGALSFIALFLPQFEIVVWEKQVKGFLFLWGGHKNFYTDVSLLVYLVAAMWGIGAAGALLWAGVLLRRRLRTAIAWMNWAAFFVAMELIFLLVAAEEVLTDLRVQSLQADSFARWGSWLSFAVLFILLFLPGRTKKALFPSPR